MNENNYAPLPWQNEQWQYLQKRFQQQCLPHALLLSGISGIGKSQFAHAFIQSLLCQHRDQQGHGCGNCDACSWFLAETHPDLLMIHPQEMGSTIKIEAIRSLIDRMTQRSHQGGYKIALISPAEAMPIAATNALLKILEEPTAQTIIILISQQPKILAATLRSRCQSIFFPTPDKTIAEAWLSKKINISAVESAQLLALADGAPFNAINLQNDVKLQEQQQMLEQLEHIIANKVDPLEVANQWLEKPLLDILNCWQIWIADLIRIKFGVSPKTIAAAELMILQKISNHISLTMLYSFYDKTNQLRQQLMTKYNPNALLALEDLLCSWGNLRNN